jgi:enhancing lycopene biosynthesis protein 2
LKEKMKKIAIVLSGCGVYDGAEIHESVLTMLAASKMGILYQMYAPDVDQMHVINHANGEVMDQKRNVLVESARIARGNVKPLSEYKAEKYDALVFPGGFGVAKNLCTFALEGVEMTVLPEVQRVVSETHSLGKPIGALCISPVVIAKLIPGVKLTIGQDLATADAINALGGEHVGTDNTGITVDEKNKIVTTPCYMLDSNVYQVAQGIEKLMKSLHEMM